MDNDNTGAYGWSDEVIKLGEDDEDEEEASNGVHTVHFPTSSHHANPFEHQHRGADGMFAGNPNLNHGGGLNLVYKKGR